MPAHFIFTKHPNLDLMKMKIIIRPQPLLALELALLSIHLILLIPILFILRERRLAAA